MHPHPVSPAVLRKPAACKDFAITYIYAICPASAQQGCHITQADLSRFAWLLGCDFDTIDVMTNSPFLVGIDIGTSGAKAAVVDLTGKLISWAGQEYAIHTPQAGWAEQQPEDWLSAALHCVKQAVQQSGLDPRQALGIGLAGQMHSLVCVNAEGEPLRPAILWADQRSAPQVQQLTEHIGPANLAAWTGNPLAAGFMLASWSLVGAA
jgi:hypothetical protein